MQLLNKLVIILFVSSLLAACSMYSISPDSYKKDRYKNYLALNARLEDSLAERATLIPEEVFKSLIDYEKSIGIVRAETYKRYMPSVDDKELLAGYIDLLPAEYKRIFSNKLLRIYFIENFPGAGMTDWVIDENGEVLYYFIFNSEMLKASLTDWLSFKSNSIFENNSAKTIVINSSKSYRALIYALLHEGSHIVDYELQITPYMDQLHKTYMHREQSRTDFTKGIWDTQKKPFESYKIVEESGINLYKSFSSIAYISDSKIVKYYKKLNSSPFVSIYSSTAWYEDFADYATYYHLAEKLDSVVTIEIKEAGDTLLLFEPIKSEQAKKRFNMMRRFYK